MGYENQYKAMEQDSQNRRAFTYPLLKLFAEGLANENMLPINAQNYLACATLGFFSSCRMGDLLKDALDTNSERLLTWEKVQFKSNREIIIYLAHPKHAKKENGVVCDVFNFPLPIYCPISNLLLLAKMQSENGQAQPQESQVVQPGSLRAFSWPRLHVALRAAAPHRLRLGDHRRHQAIPPVGIPDPRAPGNL